MQTKPRKASATRRAAPAAVAATPDILDLPEAAGGNHPEGVRVDVPTDEACVEGDHPGASSAGEGEEQRGAAVSRVGFAPIVRVDADRREIELCATSEALDSYGTVFDYAASKVAFTRWIGNVREMHERRAVGSRVSVRCDDARRKVYVRVRISRGAADTWEKLLDGTLRGASIGASNVVWERQARRVAGRERLLNVATRYDLVELSLVDNPSNPDALGISIVRDAVPDAEMLEELSGGGGPAGDVMDSGRPPDAPAAARAGETPAVQADVHPETLTESPVVPARQLREPVAVLSSAPVESRTGTTGSVGASGGCPPAHEGADVGDPTMPPEVRIARQAAAHGWAVLGASREDRLREANGPHGSALPARETDWLKSSLVRADAYHQPPLPGCGDPESAVPAGSTDTRAQGPFSTNTEGYPDAGVPARAEERPTSALGMLGMPGEGNARERFHAAARGILLGCGCPLCEGALAALGEMGTADEAAVAGEAGEAGEDGGGETRMRAPRDGGMPNRVRESALARALATGLSASVTRMERVDESVRGLGGMLQTAVSQIEGTAGALRRRVEALEAQPLPGGPAAFAFDKTLALTSGNGGGAPGQPGAAEQRRALESLAGKLTDPQAQIAVAAELIRLQRGE